LHGRGISENHEFFLRRERTIQGDYSGIEGNFSLRLGVKIREAMVNTAGK
jgi:hypothetical protein